MHYVMQEIYNNKSNPYTTDMAHRISLFKKITLDIQNKLQDEAFLSSLSPKENDAAKQIAIVFSSYGKDRFAVELIVKIPEIMATFSPDQGEKILNKLCPELVRYYENYIVPDIKQHLQKLNASSILPNDLTFALLDKKPDLREKKPAINHEIKQTEAHPIVVSKTIMKVRKEQKEHEPTVFETDKTIITLIDDIANLMRDIIESLGDESPLFAKVNQLKQQANTLAKMKEQDPKKRDCSYHFIRKI